MEYLNTSVILANLSVQSYNLIKFVSLVQSETKSTGVADCT